MRLIRLGGAASALFGFVVGPVASAYPPAVGILGPATSCASCHANNGPWTDPGATIVDVLDGATRRSLRQPDGSFLIEVPRGTTRTVVTVIGRRDGDRAPAPVRNAWLYVDPATIGTPSLSKFPPGWDVNLPMSCRIVGDTVPEYPRARVTALPMTVGAGASAEDAKLVLYAMLSSGEPAKGSPDEWLRSNTSTFDVRLDVTEGPPPPE